MLKSIAHKLFRVLAIILFLVIGFLIGKYKSVPFFHINPELNILEVVSIIINIFLAWYLSVIIGHKSDIDNRDKEIVLRRLDNTISNIETFNILVHSGNIKLNDVVSFIKRNSISVIKICQIFSTKHPFNDNHENVVINELQQLKTLMTDTPFTQSNQTDQPITINNNIVTYSSKREEEILLHLDSIINSVMDLQMIVNSI